MNKLSNEIPDEIDFHVLERRIPLDDLPAFHRAFLTQHRPEEPWDSAPLRQIQGKLQATLKGLERQGQARSDGDSLWLARSMIPEAFHIYL